MVIVLEGIDGAGKTTAAQLLCRELEKRHSSVKYWSKSSADFEDPFLRAQMLNLRELIWNPSDDKPATDILGTPYYMFLIAAWFSVLERHRIRQIQENKTIAVFDGWFYRNIAKAFIRDNLDKAWLRALFANVSEPDLVILLDIDPSVAWSRRSRFKPDEEGRWDGFTGDSFNSYCSYQQLVREQMLKFAEQYGWSVIGQTEQTSPEEVVAKIHNQILDQSPI